MKTAQKITSVFLAVIFLVSSLGFTANKMVCIKTCEAKLSLVHVKDCCPKKESSIPVIKSDCCDITNTYFNLGDLQTTQKTGTVQPFAFQCFFTNSVSVCNSVSFPGRNILSCADLPPPKSGRTLLSFISILII